MILIRKVKEEFGWLSNMSPHSVTVGGVLWRTTEHLFQALRFDDLEIRDAIRTHKSPMQAKWFAKARKDKMVVVPCSEDDLKNMEYVLAAKIAGHPDLREALLATGDREIVEDCSKRQGGSGLFWGAVIENGVITKGENTLGKLWMKLRSEIQGA